MAELVLGKLGAVAGAAVLPKGLAFLGGGAGTLAGAAIEASFLSPPREGPRVQDFHLTQAQEGAGIPIVYGRCRVGGQLIWAAQFKETRDVSGGKGGPRLAEYSYTLSFAVAICEGEIARVARCWANGEPFDLSTVTWRLYRGTDDQPPDALIEAIEGDAPAFRGTAYIVFEDLPVDRFGARLPQLSFEIIRPVGSSNARLEARARAVNLIPGSGEFVLATDIVRRRLGPGREIAENAHGPEARSDFEASLDQLEAELPQVTRINLVIAWFGDDLRCGECSIRPGVEVASKTTRPMTWRVGAFGRGEARLVSSTGGRANYGGTPCDDSVRQAVAMLKARGYHVTLYPFLLMDIPPGNTLPGLHGGTGQPPFPWRGRIAPVAGDAAVQIAAFFSEYRPFALHYAALAAETGADGVLLGSELVGLTRTPAGGAFPAVDALCSLAADVREIVGEDVEISYAADWTEYGARVVGDDVDFPLDTLWAHPAITYVGLDWYPPMADWRDGPDHLDAPHGDGRSLDYLAANIAGGEAFDWYYADVDGRLNQQRAPISDLAHGENWVFRQKDIAGWWTSPHHPRPGGVRSATPTAWIAGMKPVRFVEMGVPAVDKGANQPNLFYDPKSSESALPHFSTGARDDIIQRRAIEAFQTFWTDETNNPVSTEYAQHGGRMVPPDGVCLWAWDARPYPSFPGRGDVWGDAGNWRLGHWLNGRVGAALLSDVVGDICSRAEAASDSTKLEGIVSGYALPAPASARAALEPLVLIHEVDAVEADSRIMFRMCGSETGLVNPERISADEASGLTRTRLDMEGAAPRLRLRHVESEMDYAPAAAVSLGVAGAPLVDLEAPLSLDRGQAQRCADRIAARLDRERERLGFAMGPDGLAIEPGDIVAIGAETWRIVERSDDGATRFEAVRAGSPAAVALVAAQPGAPPAPPTPPEPDVVIVDAPALPGEEHDLRPVGFAFASPWPGQIDIAAGADATQLTHRGEIAQPCAMGRLAGAIYPHVSGRWQDADIWVSLHGASLISRSAEHVLNGANMALVETASGWELLQFRSAELVGEDSYRLSGLLRGQQGTEEAMAAGTAAGARILFLTGAEQRLSLADWERGLDLLWSAGRFPADAGSAWRKVQRHDAVAARPWTPAHLRPRWQGGDLKLSWVRRARTGGDAWTAGEPPHEWPELYHIEVRNGGVVRSWQAAEPSATYTGAMQAEDFPAGGLAEIRVAQAGGDGQPGGWAGVEVAIPAA